MATRRKPSAPQLLDEVRIASVTCPGGWPLSMPQTVSREALHALIAREAMRWTYVLRSRKRWVGGSRARERNEEEARAALLGIGIGKAELLDLARSDRIVCTGSRASSPGSTCWPPPRGTNAYSPPAAARRGR